MENSVYPRTAITLHWLIAGLLAFQIGMGFAFEGQERGPALFSAYQLHKSLGIAILVLSLARLASRVARKKPTSDAETDAAQTEAVWARRLAGGVHAAFYGFMILGPLTGWIIVSTAKIKIPTMLFGVIPLPHLPVPTAWHEMAENAHGLMSWVAIGLFILHVAGALRHQLIYQDGVMQRMFPFAIHSPRRGLISAMLAVGALLATGIWANNLRLAPASQTAVKDNAQSVPLRGPSAQKVEADEAQPPERDDKATEDAAAAKNKAAEVPAVAVTWQITSPRQLGFSASWNGSAVEGRFSDWSGTIKFSPDDLPGSKVNIRVKLASASTGDGQRDDMLEGSEFFNAAANPTAQFVSDTITRLNGDRYRLNGTLSLNGRSRPVTLNATIKISDGVARVSGGTALDRTAFGVGSGEWASTDQIAGQVAVSFDFAASKQ